MTDFVALPGATVDLPGRGGGVAQFTAAEWQQRAKVARECAAELERAIEIVTGVLSDNYFGEAKEGNRLHSQLVGVVNDWSRQLDKQNDSLRDLASACEAMDAELHYADGSSATDLRA
ncbi:hypothetical protein [Gordonia sp. NPDC003429]